MRVFERASFDVVHADTLGIRTTCELQADFIQSSGKAPRVWTAHGNII